MKESALLKGTAAPRPASRRPAGNRQVRIGAGLLLFLIAAVTLGPLLVPYGPDDKDLDLRKSPPARAHWLGTDELGRDVLTRLLYGGRISMMVGLAAVAVEVTLGAAVGGAAGYFGGWIDGALMRFAEMVHSFPFVPLAVTLSAMLLGRIAGGGIYLMTALIGLLGWPGLARMVRSQVLSLREREFMAAAAALGLSHRRRIFRHLIPNTMGSVCAYAALGMAEAILAEAGLSFLGLGVSPPTPSWGNMIQCARDAVCFREMPWLWIPPGVCILAAVLSVNLLGEGLRGAADPASRAGAARKIAS